MPKDTDKINQYDRNMAEQQMEKDYFRWFSPDKKPFRLSGFAWHDREGIYRRLPLKPPHPLSEAVDNLANRTAGGQLRFKTDSPSIGIKVQLLVESGMPHMPASGQSGFDLYTGDPGRMIYYSTGKFARELDSYKLTLAEFGKKKKMRNILINFPLYNGVRKLEIGLEPGSKLKAPPAFSYKKKIVVYGTSITQGGCASRPGMAYTNILSRALDAEFINLGFSGNGRGEPELAHIITDIGQPGLFILDNQANAALTMKTNLERFIAILRKKHPRVPILVLSMIRTVRYEQNAEKTGKISDLFDFQKETVAKLRKKGDQNIYYHDGRKLFNKDYHEFTVDGIHPNDLGFYWMAKKLEPVIRKII